MKTLSTIVAAQAAASQSGWCEVVDIYLKAPITTPWGTLDTLRLTTAPDGLAFYAPTIAPEPSGNRGEATTYSHWPLKREMVQSSSQFADQKMVLAGSNVTRDFATMLAAVDWYDVPILIRKVPLDAGVLAADDCTVLWNGFVDSAVITNQLVQFSCSNDLGGLNAVLPVENMHQNCRFSWGDDLCTALRYRSTNYLRNVPAAAGSTTTRVKTSTLSEDTASPGYTGQAVTADASTDAITLTSHGLADGDRVRFQATTMPGGLTANAWYFVRNATANTFKVALTDLGDPVDITSAGSSVVMDSTPPYGTDLVNALAGASITASSEMAVITRSVTVSPATDLFTAASKHHLSKNTAIRLFGTTIPSPLSAGVTYYAIPFGDTSFKVAYAPDQAGANVTTAGSGVSVVTVDDFPAYRVKTGQSGHWKFSVDADWGTLSAGYWTIPTAQAGLANPLLKPYITFDFGSARRPTVWRIQSVPGLPREELVRMVAIFSSSAADFATYRHETYAELPPRGGEWINVLVPEAASARYWRICIRTRWAESLFYTMLHKVQAFEVSRNFWAAGRVTFNSDTTTVALRGISRPVLESYDGELRVPALPAAPASGDLFTLERGCGRTWNQCCERRNWENFGGFLDLPNQSMLR